MLKEHWISKMISYYQKKLIKHLKIPGIVLPHYKYSPTQLFMLGFRYLKINDVDELMILIQFSLHFKEIIFIDLENIDIKLFIDLMNYDETVKKSILIQKDIGKFDYIDIKVSSLLENRKYIIPIHSNFFKVYDGSFNTKTMNIVDYTDFKQESNIYILEQKKYIKDIILKNF